MSTLSRPGNTSTVLASLRVSFGIPLLIVASLLSIRGIAQAASTENYQTIPAGSIDSVLSAGRGLSNLPVKINAFYLRTRPVTTAEFFAFTKAHPDWEKASIPSIFADESYLSQIPDTGPAASQADTPVTQVSWFAAQAYCESEGGRLPSWYEWEYVAAADETHADARKDPKWRAKILSWYSQPGSSNPAKVGGAPNYYGISNMHGLIWEWVDDFNALLVSADSRNQGDPDQLQYCGAGAISLQDRDNFAILMRVALLSAMNGANTTRQLGFRCAKNLPQEKP